MHTEDEAVHPVEVSAEATKVAARKLSIFRRHTYEIFCEILIVKLICLVSGIVVADQ